MKLAIGLLLVVVLTLGLIMVITPFIYKWVWSIVVPTCFPRIVSEGWCSSTITWKVGFAILLVPLFLGGMVGITKRTKIKGK